MNHMTQLDKRKICQTQVVKGAAMTVGDIEGREGIAKIGAMAQRTNPASSQMEAGVRERGGEGGREGVTSTGKREINMMR